jgi:catechol 2,3-dioxygenase-like lactoylglutathione lyase family enzyme
MDTDGSNRSPSNSSVYGIDHVALTVPNLDEAVGFFVEVLGGHIVQRMGPFPSRSGTSDAPDRFGRHPDTHVISLAMVRVGASVFELMEFFSPDQRRDLPRWSDLGSYHVAVRVDDVDDAAEHVRAAGLEILGDVGPGPEAGMQVLFARTPWGLIVELLSYPPGSVLAEAMSPR